MFLRDLWYMPALASSLGRGAMRREMICGQPVLLGRDHQGTVFALRDICPHRGVPLSAGRIKDDQTVECPYHGWRFAQDGVCSKIPSLVPGQDFEPEKIKVRTYPVREQDGLVWVYMAAKPGTEPRSEPPKVAHHDNRIRWHETQTFHCSVDHAVIGLMDPVHAAFVHDHWWWKRTPRVRKRPMPPCPTVL